MYYHFAPLRRDLNRRKKEISVTKRVTTMAILALLVAAADAFASGEDPAVEAAGAPAPGAAVPGNTRFVTRGGETIEGKIIDRLPNGYLVRQANDTTRVVAYEDVAAIEGESAPPAASPPQPQPAYAAPPPGMVPVARARHAEAEPAERLGRA